MSVFSRLKSEVRDKLPDIWFPVSSLVQIRPNCRSVLHNLAHPARRSITACISLCIWVVIVVHVGSKMQGDCLCVCIPCLADHQQPFLKITRQSSPTRLQEVMTSFLSDELMEFARPSVADCVTLQMLRHTKLVKIFLAQGSSPWVIVYK